MGYNVCGSYCEHGGICILDDGHDGDHDSGYCTWTTAESPTQAEADTILACKPGGPEYLVLLEDSRQPRLRALTPPEGAP